MKFIDLFAGIGGFRMGLEQAGHECAGYVEWDKFARRSYEAIYDTTGEFTETDINNVNATDLPRADIWTFGFPCQDISVAGKQKGFTDGKRSSLFFTVTGLIRELKEENKPSYLLIENVKNLLSINHGFDFLKLQIELDEIGYDCEWDVLDSAEVVPQHRERIYIVGHLRGRSTRKVFPITRENGQTVGSIKELARVNPDRHTSEGNSVLDETGVGQTVSARSFKDPMKVLVHQLGNISNSTSFGGNPQTGRVYDPNGASPTLNTMTGGGREPKVAIPVSSPDIMHKTQHGRCFKSDGDPEFTLTSRDRHGVLLDAVNLRIRKLTPRECWRLQGFPDWAFDRAQTVNSNSQLYKQAGNSVTVPIVKAIARKLG